MKKAKNVYLYDLMNSYQLTQADLAGQLDRSNISRVLSGSIKLSESMAIQIASNIKTVVGNRLKEDHEYLYLYFYNHEKYNVIVDMKEDLNLLNIYYNKNEFELFFKSFSDLESVLIDSDLPGIKVTAFKLAADMSLNNHDYNKAYSYTLRAIDNVERLNDIEKKMDLFALLVSILYYQKQHEEIIRICTNLMDKYSDIISNINKMRFLFNLGIAYKESEKTESALECFDKLKDMLEPSNTRKLADLYNAMALCYKKQGKYKEAIKLLTNVVDKLKKEDMDKVAMTFNHLLEIYIETNDRIHIQEYIEKLHAIIPLIKNDLDANNHHVSLIWFNIANAYCAIDNSEFADVYYNKTLESAKSKHDIDLQYNCLVKLFDLYSVTNPNKIEIISNSLYEVLTNYTIDRDNKIVFKILHYLTTHDQVGKATNILKFICSKEECR